MGLAATPLNDNYVLVGPHGLWLCCFYKFPRGIYHDCACCLRQPVKFRYIKSCLSSEEGDEEKIAGQDGGDESFDNLGLASSRASSVAPGGYEQEWNCSNASTQHNLYA